MVDAMIKGTSNSNPVYITNNHCMSRFDWGGGGIFVQGDSKVASNAGRLFVYNSYISSNEAGGYGGGVAVCPTGKTLVTGTDGTAIFGNTSAGNEQNANDYESVSNTGNNGTPIFPAVVTVRTRTPTPTMPKCFAKTATRTSSLRRRVIRLRSRR